MYGNLYIKTGLAKKVLQLELGADVRYFTKYYAPDYSPAIGQFYNQNPEDKIEIGSYPIVNVYANLHLKRTRFFVMMYHINQGSGSSRYFLAPHILSTREPLSSDFHGISLINGSDEEIFEIYHNGNCGCYPLYSLLSRKRQRKG